jgi:hypothetical protein
MRHPKPIAITLWRPSVIEEPGLGLSTAQAFNIPSRIGDLS